MTDTHPTPGPFSIEYAVDVDMAIQQALRALEERVLHSVQVHHYGREEDPNWAASTEHADEGVALAARDLVRLVEKLPRDRRPVGWGSDNAKGTLDVDGDEWTLTCSDPEHGNVGSADMDAAGHDGLVQMWAVHEHLFHGGDGKPDADALIDRRVEG